MAGSYATCKNWQPKGLPRGTWRLPDSAELAAWAVNINNISRNHGKDGLQLCDHSGPSYGSAYCSYSNAEYCTGSHNTTCYSSIIWSSQIGASGPNYHNAYILTGGGFNPSNNWYDLYALSARCVSTEVLK